MLLASMMIGFWQEITGMRSGLIVMLSLGGGTAALAQDVAELRVLSDVKSF